MRGEVEAVKLVAFSNQLQSLTPITMDSRMSSRGRPRKSVNWARPLAATSTQKAILKRMSSRLSCKRRGKAFASASDPFFACIKPADEEHVLKEICVQSSSSESEGKLIRVIGYSRTRCGARKDEAGKPTEPSMEPKCCSKEGSETEMQKQTCNAPQGGEEDELDAADLIGVDAGSRQWISVPLDDMEGEGGECKNRASMNSEVEGKSSSKLPENPAKSDEVRRNILVCSFNGAWHENPEVSKKKSELETHDAAYKELCQLFDGQQRKVDDMEHRIHVMRENQLKKLRKEKGEIQAAATLEQRRLRYEIAQLSLNNSRILKEKQAIERDRDFMLKDFSSKLEKALKSFRLEVDEEHAEIVAQFSLKNSRILQEKLAIERDRDSIKNDYTSKLEKAREGFRLVVSEEHAEIVAALTKELSQEQEKTCCQICFANPRDAIILPCLHFHICNECLREHQRRLKGCPTCRTKINGVLCCNLCTS